MKPFHQLQKWPQFAFSLHLLHLSHGYYISDGCQECLLAWRSQGRSLHRSTTRINFFPKEYSWYITTFSLWTRASSKSVVWKFLKDSCAHWFSTKSIWFVTFLSQNISWHHYLACLYRWHHHNGRWSEHHFTIAEISTCFLSHEGLGSPHVLPRPCSSQNPGKIIYESKQVNLGSHYSCLTTKHNSSGYTLRTQCEIHERWWQSSFRSNSL